MKFCPGTVPQWPTIFFFMSTLNMPFTKLDYEIQKPKFINTLGDIFYYTDQSFLYLSKNGVYFENIDVGEDIITIDRLENEILINNKTRILIPNLPDDLIIRLKDEKNQNVYFEDIAMIF